MAEGSDVLKTALTEKLFEGRGLARGLFAERGSDERICT